MNGGLLNPFASHEKYFTACFQAYRTSNPRQMFMQQQKIAGYSDVLRHVLPNRTLDIATSVNKGCLQVAENTLFREIQLVPASLLLVQMLPEIKDSKQINHV